MIKTEEHTITVADGRKFTFTIQVAVICNMCKKECPSVDVNTVSSWSPFDTGYSAGESAALHWSWGYSSKRDGDQGHLHFCEGCFGKIEDWLKTQGIEIPNSNYHDVEGATYRVNQMVQFADRLREALPKSILKSDFSYHTEGSSFLYVTYEGRSLVVEFHPKNGFGISMTPSNHYGEGADEAIQDVDSAIKRVIELLTAEV